MNVVRVATWNLERPSLRSWKKLPAQRAQMAAIDADVWVLTETRVGIVPAEGYYGLHAQQHPSRRPDADERWVSIWSRWPWTPVEVGSSSVWSVAGCTQTPLGPLVVFGTVLPWANERGEDASRRMTRWQVHYDELARQSRSWHELAHDGVPLIVAGDFNQDRDGTGWYGTNRGRTMLTTALAQADLTCLTADDMVANGQLARNHLVDHICLSATATALMTTSVCCWEPINSAGVRMSDHPGIVAQLQGAPQLRPRDR